jgi:hypothetical protein
LAKVFWLWCLARNRLIISAGILAVLSSQQGLEPSPQKHFSRLLVFSASHAVYR